ncbi:MAG: tetratricopeptide repeat protein [Armatimonadota bacterium]|nr:tetratricopeptide repeat protein [Armatimonadota bacterium]
MADQLGLDIAQVTGTGPQGSVTEDDVLEFVRTRLTTTNSVPKPALPASAPVRPAASAPPIRPSAAPPPPWAGEDQTERLLTMANIQFRRGQTAEAERSLAQVLEAKPRDAAAHELMADIKLARGDFAGGLSSLKSALEIEPGRATAEAKLARAALRRTEQERIKSMGVAYAGSDAAYVRLDGGSRRGGQWAALASAFLPGLGQFLNGEAVKGVVVLLCYGLGLLLLALVPGTGDALSQLFLSAAGSHRRAAPVSGFFWFLMALLTAIWLYAVVDAVLVSRRSAAAKSD